MPIPPIALRVFACPAATHPRHCLTAARHHSPRTKMTSLKVARRFTPQKMVAMRMASQMAPPLPLRPPPQLLQHLPQLQHQVALPRHLQVLKAAHLGAWIALTRPVRAWMDSSLPQALEVECAHTSWIRASIHRIMILVHELQVDSPQLLMPTEQVTAMGTAHMWRAP